MRAPLRTVFFGTPEFAACVLRHLLQAAGQVQVLAVYSQPDRPQGRGRRLLPTAVKALAQAHGIPCFAPARLRDPAALPPFAELRPDLAVVAAYGNILPRAWLAVPAAGCLNVHASLLPRYRGASPVAQAILAGDAHSGVSLMRMDAGMDTGPVYSRHPLALRADDTGASLSQRLAELGGQALVTALPQIAAGTLAAVPQDRLGPLAEAADLQPSPAPRLEKAAGSIDFAAPAAQIERQVRAFYPWPGTFVQHGELRLGILQVRAAPAGPTGPPGTVLSVGPDGLQVACGGGSLWLLQVRPAGRGTMAAHSWWAGRRRQAGAMLIEGLS